MVHFIKSGAKVFKEMEERQNDTMLMMTFFAKDFLKCISIAMQKHQQQWLIIKSYMTKRKSKPYSQNGFVKYTVWAKEIKRLRK